MFESPTIADFEMQLADVASAAARQFGRQVRDILNRMAARGARHSSMSVLQTLDAMDEGFDLAISGILRQLGRALDRTDLDPTTLRSLGYKRALELAELIPSVAVSQLGEIAEMQSVQTLVQERIALLKERGTRRLRQFDVGFWEDPDASVAPASNSIRADTIVGGIQQGTINSKLNVKISVNREQVGEAVEALERAMSGMNLSTEAKEEIDSEIDTIKAQLRKTAPSVTILREAGRSVRSIFEGIAAGIVAPEAVIALASLAAAIGS